VRRLLWSLPRVAPVLLRHFTAYLELVSLDIARAQRELVAELIAIAIVAVCGLLALLMGCLVVVACTWNTPYRVTAVACMGGGFLIVAVAAGVYRSNASKAKSEFLASVKQAWAQDRLLFESILSSDEE
jgi:uncharacterized membrane protein YqjE